MRDKASLEAVFEGRKKGLIDELKLVHEALAHAVPTEETKEWLAKLQKWHNDLHALIGGMPEAE